MLDFFDSIRYFADLLRHPDDLSGRDVLRAARRWALACFAAPTPSARVVPTGFKMPDGYRTLIVLSGFTNIQFWEKQVQPPGLEVGGIDTTTMLNNAVRTKRPKSLYTVTDITVKAGFDPDVIANIITLVGRVVTVTIWYPDGSSFCYFGFISKWQPDTFEEGKFPECAVTIEAANEDPNNSYVEAIPVFTAASGT